MIQLRRLLPWLLPVFLLLPGIAAATGDPAALVRKVTDDVLTILRQDKSIQGGDRRRAVSLIESEVAPHFDFPRMTGLAVGRAWQRADAGQRQALTGEFRLLLVRTYANALTSFRDQTVTFGPSRTGSDGQVTVRSRINRPGATPIALDYSLVQSGGDWKVFDVAVDNVSLVTNYRSTFAEEIDKGGVDGLLKLLQTKNRQLETVRGG